MAKLSQPHGFSAGQLRNTLPELHSQLITGLLGQGRFHLLYREIMGLPSSEAAFQDHHTLLGGAALAVEVGDLVALVSPC